MTSGRRQSQRSGCLPLWILLCGLLCSTITPAQLETAAENPVLDEQGEHRLDLRHSFPGGIVQLYLEKISDTLPQVRFGIREPIIIQRSDDWQVLIGLDLDILPGEYVIYIKQPDSELPGYSIKFDVTQKTLPVLADAADTELTNRPGRIAHQQQSDLDFDNTGQPDLPLKLPTEGTWDDTFGLVATDINAESGLGQNVAQNYVFFQSAEPVIVTAPQNAIISRIIAPEQPETPATVFLDHGRGLYSILGGVTDLSIETGNGVVAGAVIGKTQVGADGQTARLTWQTMINGAYVNPLLLNQLN